MPPPFSCPGVALARPIVIAGCTFVCTFSARREEELPTHALCAHGSLKRQILEAAVPDKLEFWAQLTSCIIHVLSEQHVTNMLMSYYYYYYSNYEGSALMMRAEAKLVPNKFVDTKLTKFSIYELISISISSRM